jgi:hypothetical protein
MSAEHFNTVQLALKRLSKTIRIELPKLRTLDLLLDKDAWIVVDHSLNDIPVIAWTDFDAKDRANLNQAIPCQILIYHQHATLIVEKVMEAMEIIIGEKLDEQVSESDAKVIPLKRDT